MYLHDKHNRVVFISSVDPNLTFAFDVWKNAGMKMTGAIFPFWIAIIFEWGSCP